MKMARRVEKCIIRNTQMQRRIGGARKEEVMTTLKKKGALLLLVIMTIGAVWVPVYAADDNYPYEFDLKTGHVNAYTSREQYRQTTDVYNHWKVNMRYHSRGDNAQATYWLAKASGKAKVSDTLTTTPRVGDVYRSAYASASQVYVCLGAENFRDETAHVTGYWDEETN